MAKPVPAFHTGKNKRIVINNFALRNQASNTDFQKYWGLLEDAVVKIQHKQKTETIREDLFTAVEVLCEQNFASDVYRRVVRLFHADLTANLPQLVDACERANMNGFLVDLNRFWTDFCQQLSMIQNVFMYLNRTYVLQNPTILSIWDIGLHTFRSVVVDAPKIREQLFDFILTIIEQERNGDQIDRPLMKSVVGMLVALKIYENEFEHKLIRKTEKFYKLEAHKKIDELETGEYLRYVANRLDAEQERVDFYLNYTSWPELSTCLNRCFIGEFVDVILSKGAEKLFEENRIEDLKLLYRLFGLLKNARINLKSAFVAYIKKIGRAMVLDTKRDETLVQDLIKLKAQLDKTIEVCFENNEKFIQGERDAFNSFINARANKPAELIAKFMDSKLRLGNKECSEDELDVIMDNVIVLFRFVDGKDYFEAFYKKALSKRLLMGRSASVDAEKAMLAKLKNECGAGFTQKLEGMFKDMEVSKELSGAFTKYLLVNYPKSAEIEFGVSVLTMGNWPAVTPSPLAVPPELAAQQEVFSKFYVSKHNGRKLQWQYNLASAILKATFEKGRKELEVSMFQAVVLLLFNSKTTWSLAEIGDETKIEPAELKRTLQSLACGKSRVLTKEPKGRDVGTEDSFHFNAQFSSSFFRIKISQVMLKETEAEHQETEEQVTQDRQYQIDAAVVRTMKTRKTLSHNLLISELLSQLRFATKPIDLKRRIESLIEREYMMRDKTDSNLYHYVA
ncbi:CULLIN-2 domain-containing protein [Aphelenchoides fujianensis]|nr:CULLIN-2 domain-containing protein [Aphelenchoides fujianensis]